MTDDEVDEIEYANEKGDSLTAPRSHRVRFKAAIGYYQYVTYQHLRYGVDILACKDVVNGDAFDKFFTRDYDPSQPIIRFTHQSTLRSWNIRRNVWNKKMRCTGLRWTSN
jgi:hypothetical protein